MNPALRREGLALLILAAVAVVSGSASAGFFDWFRRSAVTDDCSAAPYGPSCPPEQCRSDEDDDDDDGCGWCGRAAPAGAVVSAIPAVMVAQPAVAVSTQRLEAALFAQERSVERDRLVKAVLQNLATQLQSSAATTATQAAPQADAATLKRLEAELEGLRGAIQALAPLVDEVRQQKSE